MNKKVVLLLCDFLGFILLLAADQLTKYLAIIKLKGQPAIELIPGVLELQYLENRGSAFGMLQNQKIFLLFVGVIFMAVMIFFLIKMPTEKKFYFSHGVFTFVIAGGIGNMVDRIRFDFVVDFISFVLIDFPIFNVADIYIVLGTITLFIMFMFVYKEKDLEFLSFKQNRYREM
ncbi:MAG: signal peptidase II [Lachnospiraceae bacterium]|nr:signal peptidase II [Lachnospiraceae bacterium]